MTPWAGFSHLLIQKQYNKMKGGGSSGDVTLLFLSRRDHTDASAARGCNPSWPHWPPSPPLADAGELGWFSMWGCEAAGAFIKKSAGPGWVDGRGQMRLLLCQLGSPKEKRGFHSHPASRGQSGKTPLAEQLPLVGRGTCPSATASLPPKLARTKGPARGTCPPSLSSPPKARSHKGTCAGSPLW